MSDDESGITQAMAISSGQFAQLMAAITCTQDRLEDQIASVREELKQGQEEAAAKALKRV